MGAVAFVRQRMGRRRLHDRGLRARVLGERRNGRRIMVMDNNVGNDAVRVRRRGAMRRQVGNNRING